MKFLSTIKVKDGRTYIDFGSKYNHIRFKEFCKNNIGKIVELTPREKITKEARGYFEGALCPSYIHHVGGDPHDDEEQEITREIFKQEFNGIVVKGLNGKPIMVEKSTTKLSKEEFKSEFVQKIIDYFVEHGIPVPNPDLHKEWQNKWSIDEPLLTFWEWLDKFKIKCDCGVEEANYIIK